MIAVESETGSRCVAAASGAPGWLSLAAAPTFAIMTLLTCVQNGGADMICSAGHDVSALGGMAPMYMLMSLFHLPPWLNLIVRWRTAVHCWSQSES